MTPNEHKDILIKLNIEKSDEALKIADYAISDLIPIKWTRKSPYASAF